MTIRSCRVSVIIPVFNGEASLRDAINSVLGQGRRDFEIIVVDDGSDDRTPAIIESYGSLIRAIRQSNSGPAVARNAGVKAACGEYLAFLDADDRWMPAMLERTVAALNSDAGCVLAYGNLTMVDSEDRPLGSSLISGKYSHAPLMDEMLREMWPIMPSATLIRRSAFDACGGFSEEFRHAGYEDAFLLLRLRELGEFRYIPEALAAWRFSSFPTIIKSRPLGIDRRTFARLVSQRYGIDPTHLTGARLRATRSILGYLGLRALRDGDRAGARRAFTAALRIDPWRVRNHLRFIRTFLPFALARALSGRTRRDSA
jgi:glycosyltransferase involved in cell wall biosynthesis